MREQRMTVRLRDDRAEAIKTLATASQKSRSEVVRLAVDALVERLPPHALKEAVRPTWKTSDIEVFRSVRLALRRVGNNVNQIARKLHIDGVVDLDADDSVMTGLLAALEELDMELDAIRRYREEEVEE